MSHRERSAGRTLSKHGVRKHCPRTPEGLTPAGIRDFASDLPHPWCSKQPQNHTEGTAGVLGAGNHQGQHVTSGMTGTEMPHAMDQPRRAPLGALGAEGASSAPCCCHLKISFFICLSITLSLQLQRGSWLAHHPQPFSKSPQPPMELWLFVKSLFGATM